MLFAAVHLSLMALSGQISFASFCPVCTENLNRT